MRHRISIRGSVRRSVGPSVRPSVRYASSDITQMTHQVARLGLFVTGSKRALAVLTFLCSYFDADICTSPPTPRMTTLYLPHPPYPSFRPHPLRRIIVDGAR